MPTSSDQRLDQDYSGKAESYFSAIREDFLALLPGTPDATVLEIGCGAGGTGRAALERGRCGRYVGVELFSGAAETARRHLSEVLVGDVERLDLPWPEGHFDAVLMSEVLEHLVDPWRVVERIVPLLRPGALVMASSPNVAQIRMVRSLLGGRWELADFGLMDRTHLRWFTPHTYREMFERAGIEVRSVTPMAPAGRWGRLFNGATGHRFAYLTMRQICLVGRVPGGPR